MRISTKVIIEIATGRVLERESCDYFGPLELACGSTAAQQSAQANEATLANSETSFYNSLQQDFSQVFGQNENIMQSLNSAFQPIISAGVNQQGFSPAELTAMQTQASDLTTTGAQNAQIAAAAKNATTGGSQIPSGAQQQIGAMINESAANENAQQQGQITQANYATGRQNFFNAEQGLVSGTEGLESAAAGFSGAASGAGNAANAGNQAALEGATAIEQANDAWYAPLMGAIGSIGASALAKKP